MHATTIEEFKAYTVIDNDDHDAVIGMCTAAAEAFVLRYTGLSFDDGEVWPADLKLATIKIAAQHFEHREGVLVDQSASTLPHDVQATLDSYMVRSFAYTEEDDD